MNSANETDAEKSPAEVRDNPKIDTVAESHTKQLLSSTFHYGLGKTLPQVVRFCLLPVYARFLTAAD